MRVLINFDHGIGDSTQLTIVLKHIKKIRPHWIVDVRCLMGKHSVFNGLCNAVYLRKDNVDRKQYDKVFDLSWYESFILRTDLPATKVTRCLIQILQIQPNEKLYYYDINVRPPAERLAEEYISNRPKPRKGFIIIHYQGNTSAWNKNLPEPLVKKLCQFLAENQYHSIILDWDNRTNLPNRKTIFCPGRKEKLWMNRGCGDGEVIAALIKKGALFIGIDSGPLHIAAATDVPSIGIWTHHHPVHFFDLADNVTHLLPKDAIKNLRGKPKNKMVKYFEEKYDYKYYDNLKLAVFQEVCSKLKLKMPPLEALNIDDRPITTEFVKGQNWWMVSPEPDSTMIIQ